MAVLIGFVIAIVASIATTTICIAIVWQIDRHEKEPIGMLALAFLWGMLPAVIISMIFELALALPLADSMVGNALEDAGIVPIVEESAKGLALLAFLVFSFREFDGILDGIVYGAMIGLGFGFTENILYVVSGVAEKGLVAGLFILFLRTVIFGMNHAFFTSLTGAGVGAARLTRGVSVRLGIMSLGWLLAVIFHGVHNLGATMAEETGMLSVGVSFISDWAGIAMLFVVVALVWRKEQGWMTDELAGVLESGVLTAEEYAAMASPAGRQRLLTHTLRSSGWGAYRRMGRQYQLFAELAFKKRQVRLVGEEPGVLAEIARLRYAILQEKGMAAP